MLVKVKVKVKAMVKVKSDDGKVERGTGRTPVREGAFYRVAVAEAARLSPRGRKRTIAAIREGFFDGRLQSVGSWATAKLENNGFPRLARKNGFGAEFRLVARRCSLFVETRK